MDAPQFTVQGSPSGVDRIILHTDRRGGSDEAFRLVGDILPALRKMDARLTRRRERRKKAGPNSTPNTSRG